MPAGGAETQIYLLARALSNRGRRVCIATDEAGAELPHEVDGIVIRARRRAPARGRGLVPVAHDFAHVARTLAPIDADVFVQRSAGVLTGYVGLCARGKKRRFVYSSSSVIDFDFARVAGKRSRLWLYGLGLRLAERIVVQTLEQERLCQAHLGREAVVIRSIAEPAELRKARPEAFLWVGNLAPAKRAEAYLGLARALPEARFRLVAAASPAERRRLEAAAGGIENVELLPPRPRSKLMGLIESAVAVVNTADYEGLPNVFLEGWSRGVPTLSLTHDPDGVIERERLGGFARGDERRLASLASRLWQERGAQTRVAARCRAYVQREHAPEQIAERWIQALRLA